MKFRFNENGNLAAAIVLSLVAVLSGLSLTVLAMGDTANANDSFILMQETHLLRSGLDRGHNYVNKDASGGLDGSIPQLTDKKFFIESGRSRVTYIVRVKLEIASQQTQDQIISTSRGVSALIRAFRKEEGYAFFNSRDDASKSRFEKYAERKVQKQTFAGYMYFTNTDISVNNDPVKFYTDDEIWGRVHSNTNIVLRNGSRPRFHDLVTSAEEIIYESGNRAPLNDQSIFMKGAKEHVAYIEYAPTAYKIRENGRHIDEGQDIIYAKIDGANHIICKADINDLPPEVLTVYNSFPPYGAVGDSLFDNVITFQDTNWTSPSSGSLSDGSIFVHSQLWIHGNFGGKQTWASEDDLFLVGDVTLVNTPVGEAPDGYDEANEDYTGPVNRNDFVGLVSEKRIFIKYAYTNPVDTLQYYDNCGQHNVEGTGIYIYAALAALGHGEGWEDGNFSYEYQYPHPSTPHQYDFANTDENFKYPDLHLCKYPPVNQSNYWPWPANGGGGFGYPGNLNPYGAWQSWGAPDYPWYNPVFPSPLAADAFSDAPASRNRHFERGMIMLYGSVSQSRRGFVHRSGGDPLDTGHWDLDNPVSPWFGPGTTSTGYDKRYHFDNRFSLVPPPDYPEVKMRNSGSNEFQRGALVFRRPPRTF